MFNGELAGFRDAPGEASVRPSLLHGLTRRNCCPSRYLPLPLSGQEEFLQGQSCWAHLWLLWLSLWISSPALPNPPIAISHPLFSVQHAGPPAPTCVAGMPSSHIPVHLGPVYAVVTVAVSGQHLHTGCQSPFSPGPAHLRTKKMSMSLYSGKCDWHAV